MDKSLRVPRGNFDLSIDDLLPVVSVSPHQLLAANKPRASLRSLAEPDRKGTCVLLERRINELLSREIEL